MKVPLSWLREYVDAPASAAELAKLLVMAGTGVESIEGDVLDLEITANRADLLSMLGVAREVGVLLGKRVRIPAVTLAEGTDALGVEVEVAEPGLCPRYTARVIRGVKVGSSPAWLVQRLESAGVRPVNNVVDVTNYVLLECGQPLHAFDANLLRKIVVRRAAAGEKLTAIDGKTYLLDRDRLVIADAGRPVAIAGVMGGKESEIGPATTEVVLESAQFDPVSVRRTSRRLGLSSESSYRFERGVDYETVDWASRRAAQIILQLAGGRAAKGSVEASVPAPPRPVARVRPARVGQVLGMQVPTPRIREILAGLGCSVGGTDAALEVTAPAGRRDLRIEVDYIEEVARVEGYDRIPCDTQFGLRVAVDDPRDLVCEAVRATLTGMGAYEVLTWSFAEVGTPNRVPFWSPGPLLPLRDPQGNVDRTLRESLAPRLLEVLQTNESYREELHPVFEVAQVYFTDGKGFGERAVLGLAVPGDVLDAKGLLETLFRRLSLPFEVVPAALPFLRAGTGAEIRSGGMVLGYLGSATPGLTGLKAAAAVAEVDFGEIVRGARLGTPYRDFNRQPPVERDLNVVLAEGTPWREIEAALRAGAPAALESVRFLSEYRGKGVEPGKKAVAFSMVFRAPDRTLTGEEAEGAVKAILNSLQAKLGAALR